MATTITTLKQIKDASERYTARMDIEAFISGGLDTLKAMHEHQPGHELYLYPGDYPMCRRAYMNGSDFVINNENAERIRQHESRQS